jgi:hypothetical protein
MNSFLPTDMSDSDSDVEPTPKPAPKGRPKKPTDSFMNLSECFNQHKLNHIIENEEKFKPLMREKSFEDNYDPFSLAKKYLTKSHTGKLNVCYKQNASVGRFCGWIVNARDAPRDTAHNRRGLH